jgi:MarR family transcriptional regulator, transcriptional regulator for hemolysin
MHDTRDEAIGLFTSNTVKNIIRFLSVNIKNYDITPEQWTVLKRLSENDGINQKELANKAEKDQPTVTRILDILERKELVIKKKNEEDRRSFILFITDKGTSLKEELTPIIEAIWEDEILTGIPEEELEIYRKVLMKMNENLEK